MIIVVLGIMLGFAIGYVLPISFSTAYSLYLSVAILAAIDSIFGAVKANIENHFDGVIFVSGFFSNAILAGILAYIGDVLGIPLYYAAIFVFGVRLFQNLAIIRRAVLHKYIG